MNKETFGFRAAHRLAKHGQDPAAVAYDLVLRSVQDGSGDNHTAIVIALGDVGKHWKTSIGEEDNKDSIPCLLGADTFTYHLNHAYVFGPFLDELGADYIKRYERDALAHGRYRREEW